MCHIEGNQFAHIAKDEQRKLDSKARKCIFLKYDTETKGYRLYNPKCARVVYCRDVLFNESSCRAEKEPTKQKQEPIQQVTNCYVELEHFIDEERLLLIREAETTTQLLRGVGDCCK